MKKLEELTRSAIVAAGNTDRIIKPLGTLDGKLFFDALPAWCEAGAKLGLPYAYCADLETGEARFCSLEERDLLTIKELGPIPE